MANKSAEESLKTRKTREKLQKKLELLEKKITPQALERQVEEIRNWIARNAMHRVSLLEKEIALFDENKNTAQVSRKVSVLVAQIEKEIEQDSVSKRGTQILQRILQASSSALT